MASEQKTGGAEREASGGLQFDESAARGLERIYQTPDVVAQRLAVLDALSLRPGESVLDIGVGPGLLLYDMGAIVGPQGHAAGVDLSEPMLATSARRCREQSWVELERADAVSLPFAGARFDAVVSTQVYEYVSDMPAALAEARRVLRPGGRLVVLDTDWQSLVWRTRDPERHARIVQAWDAHLHDPHLPRQLPSLLRHAGFALERTQVVPLLNVDWHPHCYSFGILLAIQGFVAQRPEVGPELAQAWADDLRQLGAAGDYFFSLNRYLFRALRGRERCPAP